MIGHKHSEIHPLYDVNRRRYTINGSSPVSISCYLSKLQRSHALKMVSGVRLLRTSLTLITQYREIITFCEIALRWVGGVSQTNGV